MKNNSRYIHNSSPLDLGRALLVLRSLGSVQLAVHHVVGARRQMALQNVGLGTAQHDPACAEVYHGVQ